MSELDDLASLLHSRTFDGKIRWTLDSDLRIHTMQIQNIIEIVNKEDGRMSLKVRNKDGIILAEEDFKYFDDAYDNLVGIFNKVRRISLKVDETLSEITSNLKAL